MPLLPLLPLLVLAAGCARPALPPAAEPAVAAPADPTKPAAEIRPGGRVHDGRFTPDGKGFVGWVAPLGKDPNEVARHPRPFILWDVATGREVARRTLDVVAELLLPGTADGKEWLTHENQPPVFFSKYRFLDLNTGTRTDIPGVADPNKTCTPPSLSADRARLAYSDYEEPRRGHVYERAAGGWKALVTVPGENARLSPDGKSVATVTIGPFPDRRLEVNLYTVADGKRRWAGKVDSYGLGGFTPDGKYVVQNDNAGWRLFGAATGAETLLIPTRNREWAAAPAYHGGFVLAAERTNTPHELVRWGVAAGKEVARDPLAEEFPGGRGRTPAFGSPRLAVLSGPWNRRASPADAARVSVLGVSVRDPARPDWKADYELPGVSEVRLSPDGTTLAAVGYGGVSFYRVPD